MSSRNSIILTFVLALLRENRFFVYLSHRDGRKKCDWLASCVPFCVGSLIYCVNVVVSVLIQFLWLTCVIWTEQWATHHSYCSSLKVLGICECLNGNWVAFFGSFVLHFFFDPQTIMKLALNGVPTFWIWYTKCFCKEVTPCICYGWDGALLTRKRAFLTHLSDLGFVRICEGLNKGTRLKCSLVLTSPLEEL